MITRCELCEGSISSLLGDCNCGDIEQEKNRRKKLTIDGRWEEGIPHYPEAEQLIRLVDKLDKDDALQLDMGGDGDPGETLAYFLDVLIENDIVEIKIKGKL